MAIERRRVRFTGRVQGVGFRMACRGLAGGRPITGWVRNEPDGSVRLEAQGEHAEIDAFVEAIRASGTGRVDAVEVELCDMNTGEDSFQIMR